MRKHAGAYRRLGTAFQLSMPDARDMGISDRRPPAFGDARRRSGADAASAAINLTTTQKAVSDPEKGTRRALAFHVNGRRLRGLPRMFAVGAKVPLPSLTHEQHDAIYGVALGASECLRTVAGHPGTVTASVGRRCPELNNIRGWTPYPAERGGRRCPPGPWLLDPWQRRSRLW